MGALPDWLQKLAPIALLLVVVSVVIARLPRVEGLDHSDAFRRRRVMNWVPLGLLYAFLYFGRYNLKVSQGAFGKIVVGGTPLMTNQDFAAIFFWGTLVYGVAFVVNGPLTDRIGGKRAILISGAGAAAMNTALGLAAMTMLKDGPGAALVVGHRRALFSLLYALNMYFQSFGAVAIVKVNAAWFHVRERGVIGAVFGILISLGLYFAYDWSALILKLMKGSYHEQTVSRVDLVFVVPALLLALLCAVVAFAVANTPGEAGHRDFDTADASSGDDGPRLGAADVFKRMLQNPIVMTIACVEFCSGYLRQAVMQWFPSFAEQTDSALHFNGGFVKSNWGMLLCCAGILGGAVAGVISDRVFQSRRGPVASVLYMGMLGGGLVLLLGYRTPAAPWVVVAMSMFVIGVHGALSGTASMDFGGKKNVGVAVGIIDGFVYLGTAVMSLVYGWLLPNDADKVAAANPANWAWWPRAMIPVAIVGLLLALRLWNARPQAKAAAAH